MQNLQKEDDGKPQSYLWDRNVAGMKEDGQGNYYIPPGRVYPLRSR